MHTYMYIKVVSCHCLWDTTNDASNYILSFFSREVFMFSSFSLFLEESCRWTTQVDSALVSLLLGFPPSFERIGRPVRCDGLYLAKGVRIWSLEGVDRKPLHSIQKEKGKWTYVIHLELAALDNIRNLFTYDMKNHACASKGPKSSQLQHT